MRTKGQIASWNDGKGYGFIAPAKGAGRVFAHIKAFEKQGRRPVVGDAVTFSMATDARGRPCAKGVIIASAGGAGRWSRAGVCSLLTAAAFLLLVAFGVQVSVLPPLVLLLYLLASASTFGAYALDKSAARRGAWRTSESTLHLLALAGGWPGALIAQTLLRHKTRKQPFRVLFWMTAVINCAAFVWSLTPEGARALRQIVDLIA